MDAALHTQLSVAALVCSVAALFFSLVAAFPALKHVLAAVRDGVLWLALLMILSGVAFIAWHNVQRPSLLPAANVRTATAPGLTKNAVP